MTRKEYADLMARLAVIETDIHYVKERVSETTKRNRYQTTTVISILALVTAVGAAVW